MAFSLRFALLALVLIVSAIGLSFYLRQNRARALGGKISRAKAAWLTFAVLFWLGVCPLLAFEPSLPLRWRVVLGVFGAQFWLRGLVELWMLYVTKSWRPPHGIAHDLFSLILVVTIAVGFGPVMLDAPNLVGLGATTLVVLSLMAETYYAWVFFGLVEGKTTGDTACGSPTKGPALRAREPAADGRDEHPALRGARVASSSPPSEDVTFTTDRMDVPGATLTYDVFDTERPDAPWLVLVIRPGRAALALARRLLRGARRARFARRAFRLARLR
ncbi:MAG: hypothetical protein R3B99_03395 [Polyangiales bacterium]